MSKIDPILVEKIHEIQVVDFGKSVNLLVESQNEKFEIRLPQNLLMNLLLLIIKAKTQTLAEISGKPGEISSIVDPIQCEFWEVRASVDREFLFLCFRLTNGGWIRVQLSSETSVPIRETLESFDKIERIDTKSVIKN